MSSVGTIPENTTTPRSAASGQVVVTTCNETGTGVSTKAGSSGNASPQESQRAPESNRKTTSFVRMRYLDPVRVLPPMKVVQSFVEVAEAGRVSR